jgi:hypothetical protein
MIRPVPVVAAVEPLNVLINYWWQPAAEVPFPALIHALMSVCDVPAGEREAWRVWFDYYVFGSQAGATGDHLPSYARGVLSPPSPTRSKLIKDHLIKALSRQ